WTATDAGLLLIPSSITTGIMMPIIGKLLERGISHKYLASAGFVVFFLYSFWMYNLMTPDTASELMFWPLVTRGIGLGLLFVPITTLSLSTLQGKDIGEGAAFTGMMRQLGGSFGIAIITTMVSRLSQQHRVDLIPNISAINFQVQQRIQGLKQMFMSKGFSANESLDRAYQVLNGSIVRQSAVLSYMDIFLYLGILFLICVPFVLMIRKKKMQTEPAVTE
ncbi:MAG: MFS transporter, partial [Christiangramia sp.]